VLTYLPAVVAIGALALTYVFCLRPMRGGACLHRGAMPRRTVLDGEIDLARTELELLRLRQGTHER
jgi:hypothetical protein